MVYIKALYKHPHIFYCTDIKCYSITTCDIKHADCHVRYTLSCEIPLLSTTLTSLRVRCHKNWPLLYSYRVSFCPQRSHLRRTTTTSCRALLAVLCTVILWTSTPVSSARFTNGAMDPAEALQLARLAAPYFEKAGLPRMAPQVATLSLSFH